MGVIYLHKVAYGKGRRGGSGIIETIEELWLE